MAGIGFELKKLFEKKSLSTKIVGAMYSIFSTIGHFVSVIIVLVVVHALLRASGLAANSKDLYFAIVLYAFIFPLIFTSGFTATLSRYVADQMWNGKSIDVLASLYGSLTVYLAVATPPAIIFLCFARLPFALSLFAYMLYMLVGTVFMLMVYLSALKNYRAISAYFVVGMVVTLVLSYVTVVYLKNYSDIVTLLIGYFVIGFSIIAIGLFWQIKKFFHEHSNKYFDFLGHIKTYPELFFGNMIYTIGLYIQNFVFWLFPQTRTTVGAYIYSEAFDFATFLGVLTILPSIVMFVVRMETSFYEYYREYLHAINTQRGESIIRAKALMKRLMWKELFYVADIQVLCTLLCIVVCLVYFPTAGIQSYIIDMFPYLASGFMLTYLMFVTGTLMQYFENYRDCCSTMLVFTSLNGVFTVLSVLLGSNYYGFGLIFASAISLIVALTYLYRTLNNVDYIVFCSQSLRQEEKRKKGGLIDILNGAEKEA